VTELTDPMVAPAGAEEVAVPGSPHRLRRIEGLRALAAGLVVYYHVQRAVGLTHPGIVPAWLVPWNERLGPFGVGIFFVLSGFLLYRPFVQADLAGTPPPALGHYFLRRFTRIYPAYWVALAALFFVVGPSQLHSFSDWAVFFGLFQNYRNGSMLRGLGVAWTLVIEVSFYVTLPLIAAALRSRPGTSPGRRLARQLGGLAVMYATGVLVRTYAYWYKPTFRVRTGAFQPQWYPENTLLGYLDWFAVGMLLAVGAVWWQHRERMPGALAWCRDRVWPAWLVAVGLYGALTHWLDFPRPGSPWPYGVAMVVLTTFPWLAGLVVAPIVLAPEGRGWARRALGTRIVVAVGTISYGIYLWHLVVNLQVLHWISAGTLPRSAVLHAGIVVVATLVLAAASYVIVERPFMAWSARAGRRSTG